MTHDSAHNDTPRHRLLAEAMKITAVDRNKAYGNPEDNFSNIANLWNAYFTAQGILTCITSCDVANLMILMKVARLSTNLGHRDSLLDIAGYAACGADCQEATAAKTPASDALRAMGITMSSAAEAFQP
jgi:hypothetical protein